MDGTPGAFSLPANDAKILRELFTHYSKEGEMRFHEFLQLSLEKNLVSNRFNFAVLLNSFMSVATEEGKLPSERFPNLLTIIAAKLIPGEKKPIFSLINHYLGDKTVAVEDRIEKPRFMIPEDQNKKLLLKDLVKVYLEFEPYLQLIFAAYHQTNYQKKKIFHSWRDLCLQEKKLSVMNFIRMLDEAEITINLISKETVSDIVAKIAVAQNRTQTFFYNDKTACDYVEMDSNPNGKTMHEGDPGLYYYEFCFALARVGLEVTKEIEDKRKSEIWDQFRYFMNEMMGFVLFSKLKSEAHSKKPDYSRYTKKMVPYLIEFEHGLADHAVSSRTKRVDEVVIENPREDIIMEEIMMLLQSEIDLENVKNIISQINYMTNPLPPPPEPNRENLPPYQKPVTVLGEQVPVGKEQKKKPPQKKPSKEKPPKYEDLPGPAPPKSHDVFFKYKEILDKERRLFDIQNGTMSKVEVDPVILKEIIYPIDPPSEKAVMFLEACFHAYNEGRIVFALKNLEEAINEFDSAITALDNVFFHFLRASILESACRDDLALGAYEKSYIASKSIPINHPDRALPMMGFGSVLYSSGEFELAARCFVAAKEIREKELGQDTADTATCYNNLGCCLIKLERKTEAFKLVSLAEAIFTAELGTFHERTLAAKRNKEKAAAEGLDLSVNYRPMWQFYFEDKTSKIGKGGVNPPKPAKKADGKKK